MIAAVIFLLIVIGIATWLLIAKFGTHTWPFALSDEDKRDDNEAIIYKACPGITGQQFANTSALNMTKAVARLKANNNDCTKLGDLIPAPTAATTVATPPASGASKYIIGSSMSAGGMTAQEGMDLSYAPF